MMRINKNIPLFLAFIVSLTFSFPTFINAETEVEDQYCENSNIENVDGYWLIKAHTPVAQTFSPTKNRLTQILLAVQGGAEVTTPITMELSLVGGDVLISQVQNTTTALAQWLTYSFDPIILDTTKTYKITVTTTSNTANWIVSTVPCYPGGTAFVDGDAEIDQDFGFVTRGYNVTPPAPTPATIAKPTTLTAEYLGQTDGVKIDWSASSTTDITGYYIYRSESETGEFTKIGTVTKAFTEYIDHGIVEEITYYYQVRAYKGDIKSVASPTASADIPSFVVNEEDPLLIADSIPAQEEDNGETAQNENTFIESISNYLIGGAFVLLAIIVFVVFLATKKKTPKIEESKIKRTSVTTPPARVESIKVDSVEKVENKQGEETKDKK